MGVVKFCIGAFLLLAICEETRGNHSLSTVVPPVSNVVHAAPYAPNHYNQHFYLQNPFLNPNHPLNSQPHPLPNHHQPLAVVTQPPISPHNPFLNPQKPHTGIVGSTTQNIVHSQQPSVGVTVPPISPHNPFLHPHQPPVGVSQPAVPCQNSTESPHKLPITITQPTISPQNPFLHPHQPPVGQSTVSPPIVYPQQPAAVVTQSPQATRDLQKGCLRARGQFPSDACNKYISCWDGVAVEQFCPPGLAFNSAGFCDHIYNVDCYKKPLEVNPDIVVPVSLTAVPTGSPVLPTTPIPPSYLPPGSAPVDPNLRKKCGEGRGLYASDYCNKYVNCWDGNAVEQDCPPGLLFSAKGYCDFAYNVNCYNRILQAANHVPPQHTTSSTNIPHINPTQGSVTPTAPLGNISDPKLRKKCLQEQGLFPSDYCNKYVNCWGVFAIEQECPAGLFFSDKGYCDYAYNVNCYNRTVVAIPIPQPPSTNLPPENVKPSAPQGSITTPTHSTSKPPITGSLGGTTVPSYVPVGNLSDQKLRKRCLTDRGIFPSEYCHKFVNCWDSFVVEQECPVGLLFSEKGYCDYAYNVNCHNRTFAQTPATSTPSTNLPSVSVKPTQPTYKPPLNASLEGTHPSNVPVGDLTDQKLRKKCLRERGLFPSDYCHKFVNCWDKYVIEQECPAGLYFSEKGYCDYAYNVNCYNRTVITIPVTQPPTSPSFPSDNLKPKPPQAEVAPPPYRPPLNEVITVPTQTNKPSLLETTTYVPTGVVTDHKLKKACLKPRGQFPSDICNKYVNCWDGYIIEQDCLPGLLFSEQGYCDYAYNVDCKKRIIITIPLSQPTTPPLSGQPALVPGNPTTPLPQQPTPITVTQIPLVVTHQPVSPAVPVVQPVNPEVQRRCLGLRGQFPSDSCHKYIDCWDHVAVEHACPPGLLFSEKGYCDYAYNVNCNNRTVIKSTPNPLCPAPHGTFRDSSNCSRYFTCSENVIAAKYDCPTGLNFNEVIGVCDYAYRVDCNREPFSYQQHGNIQFVPNAPSSLMEATAGCAPGKVIRLNPDCTSVALCRNAMTEIVHCPLGLAYDAPSDRCLSPKLCKCQDS